LQKIIIDMKTVASLYELQQTVNEITESVQRLQTYPEDILCKRKTAGSWNVLECLKHLTLYAEHYLPEIESALEQSTDPADDFLKSGLLGRYFIKMILSDRKMKPMKTLAQMDPLNYTVNKDIIHTFLEQQYSMQKILKLAEDKNLNRIKITTSFSSLIRLRLGDFLQLYVYHMKRHIVQIEENLSD